MAKHRDGLSVAELLEEARADGWPTHGLVPHARRVRPYVRQTQFSPGRWTWTGGLYDDLDTTTGGINL